MARKIILKTKRLIISPLSEEEMMKLILTERDDEARRLYTAMLADAREHAEAWNFHTAWRIAEKNSPDAAEGTIFLRGETEKGTVEAAYEVRPDHKGEGLIEEALPRFAEWLFGQQDIYRIETVLKDAEVREEMLEKIGFRRTKSEETGHFALEKPRSNWLPVYLCLGLSTGLSLGLIGGRMAFGAALGIVLGLLAGFFMDRSESSHREQVTGKKAQEALDNGRYI